MGITCWSVLMFKDMIDIKTTALEWSALYADVELLKSNTFECLIKKIVLINTWSIVGMLVWISQFINQCVLTTKINLPHLGHHKQNTGIYLSSTQKVYVLLNYYFYTPVRNIARRLFANVCALCLCWRPCWRVSRGVWELEHNKKNNTILMWASDNSR